MILLMQLFDGKEFFLKRFSVLLVVMLVGCGVNPGKTKESVEIEGTVTVAGKPVNNVTLNLQVTGTGTPATLKVTKGAVKGLVTPGNYTYYLSQASSAADFKSVPAKAKEGSLDRQIEIKGPGPVAFTFD